MGLHYVIFNQKALVTSFAVLFFLFFPKLPDLSAASLNPLEVKRDEIVRLLQTRKQSVQTLKIALKIGISHPTAPLIQWSNGLLAWRKEPEFLYVKGYKPLVPLYFILKSEGGAFWIYLARQYTVFWGKNEVLEHDIDIDLKLQPQDIITGLSFPSPETDGQTERILLAVNKPDETYQLTIKRPNGNMIRRISFDSNNNPKQTIEYNEFGFPFLEIAKEDWRMTNGIPFPFRIKVKRLLPRPGELVLELKEIRLNVPLEPEIFKNPFPEAAKQIELKEETKQ